ncbi:MAG: rhomboid family intramembrane serine protease [Anaerolineae bacterium]|nr:rhomboid family intramembrane serine protease [Anaerolineae bacterium]
MGTSIPISPGWACVVSGEPNWWTPLTSMFLHGGWFHIFSNMMALWVFGRRVEDVCGPWRFLAFYLACGFMADIVAVVTRMHSDQPGIGASGALYGVMAAYLMLFPKGRIRILFLYWFLPVFNMTALNGLWVGASALFWAAYILTADKGLMQSVVSLYFPTPRAYLVILYFVLLEIPRALEVLVFDIEASVGHWAHLGGFLAACSSSFSYVQMPSTATATKCPCKAILQIVLRNLQNHLTDIFISRHILMCCLRFLNEKHPINNRF